MSDSVIQTAFSAGEISPELAARVDIDKYRVSAALMRNYFVSYKGGAVNRPGTRFCGFAKTTGEPWKSASAFVRLIPFVYSTDQSYALVLTPLKIRFMSRGGYVLESAKTITGITKANPGVITSNAHGFNDGDLIFINSIAGMTELNGSYFEVANETVNTFTLKSIVTGTAVDTSGFTTYSSGGSASRVVTVVSPWDETTIGSLDYEQAGDVMVLFNQATAPQTLTRNSHTSWTLAAITFAPTISAPTGQSVSSQIGAGNTGYTYKITAVSSIDGSESLPSSEANYSGTYWTGSKSNRITWNSVANALFYNIYRQRVTFGRGTPANAIFGHIGSTKATTFDDCQIAADYGKTPPTTQTPFTGANNYPKTGKFHGQRLLYASTLTYPTKIWGSVVASFYNMNYSIPARDSDALDFQLASTRVDGVQHLISMTGGLIALTASGTYEIVGEEGFGPLTPSSIDSKPKSNIGASRLKPIVINDDVLYEQVDGYSMRDLVYSPGAKSFEDRDLTALSSHFFEEYRVTEWAYAAEPWKIVWGARGDGKFVSLTYMKEHGVSGWALHETNGFVKSVCAIPEDGEDFVYLAVVRPSLTPRFEAAGGVAVCIERMESRLIQSLEDSWFLDCAIGTTVNLKSTAALPSALTGSGVTLTASAATFSAGDVGKHVRGGGGKALITAYTDTTHVTVTVLKDFTAAFEGTPLWWSPNEWSIDPVVTSITGLHHLNGSTVTIFADGADSTGAVASSVLATPSASKIIAGLPFKSQLMNSRLEFEPTVQGKRKTIPAVTVRVYKSYGHQIGYDFDHLESTFGSDLTSGDFRTVIGSDWSPGGQVAIQQSRPYPSYVLGIIPEIVVGDT